MMMPWEKVKLGLSLARKLVKKLDHSTVPVLEYSRGRTEAEHLCTGIDTQFKCPASTFPGEHKYKGRDPLVGTNKNIISLSWLTPSNCSITS